jgi:tripartite-type tricarboxylate transporter receptor subunit TctC
MLRYLICLLMLWPAAPWAQGYPSKPVRMIVPFAPGGASDFVGRIMQPRLSELLGQQVIVENRAGASGNIGLDAAAKAPADGYTFFLGNIGTVAINPAVFAATLSVTPTKDFIAVTQVVDVPSALVAHPSLPAGNARELVAYAKANPGKLNYGSPGSGSQNRLEMEVLRKLENLDMVHIPYKGGAGPAITGLIGGETHLMFVTVSSAIGHVKGGRLKLLGVSSANRIGAAPDVPTLAESGYPDLTGGSWQGVFVPAGTPKEVVERLLPAVLQTMQTQDVVTRLNNGGVEVVTSSPAAFSEFVAAETRKWARVVKESNATPD